MKKANKIIWISVALAIVIMIVCFLFIQLFTPTAAKLADKMRPIIGNGTVLFAERIYLNTADRLKLSFQNKQGSPPQFPAPAITIDTPSPVSGGLNLTPLTPISSLPKLDNEGIWTGENIPSFPNQMVAAHTFIRPDRTRAYAVATVLQIDLSKISIGAVAGTQEPGGLVGRPGSGKIPREIWDTGILLAAFTGGFQFRDGGYGMIVGDNTIIPLENNVGTLVAYKNGAVKIFNYQGEDLGPDVAMVRQNCPILVENGKSTVDNQTFRDAWQSVASYNVYTVRSALGLNKDGNLIYIIAKSTTDKTLADAMIMAGAVNAIELDLNPFWVRFNWFEYLGVGKYQTRKLTDDLTDGTRDYETGHIKDYFYLYHKP